MKTKKHQSPFNRRTIQQAGLFLSVLFMLNTAQAANQCANLFKDAFKLDIKFSTEINQVQKDAQVIWSKDGNYVSFSQMRIHFVTDVATGKLVNLGTDKPSFSADGNSFYYHDKGFGEVYLYNQQNLKPQQIKTQLNYVVDFRQGKLVGTKDTQRGFFVEDSTTGKTVAHYDDFTVVVKEADPQYLIGLKYPSAFQATSQTGYVQIVNLKSLESGLEVSNRTAFHSIDENFRGDFIKIGLTSEIKSTAVVRKKDGTVVPAPNGVVRAYEINDKDQHFVVQSETELSIYRGMNLINKISITKDRDLKILGFSKQLSAFVGFDRSILRLVYLTRFSDDYVHVALGPKINELGSQAEVHLLNTSAVIYMGVQGLVKILNLSSLEYALARPQILKGLSPDKKSFVYFNSDTNKWNLYKIVDESKK